MVGFGEFFEPFVGDELDGAVGGQEDGGEDTWFVCVCVCE